MDSNAVKWLCFTGSAEDYPAWSTKFTAFMQTKGLFKSLLGKEVIPEEIAPLAEDASAEQQAQRQAKVQQRNKEIEDIKERNNNVWCHIALALDKTSLMYIRHDCLSQDGTGDGAKAWRLLQQRYSNIEKPTVVSLVRQISRLQLGEDEKLHEYFIRAQELMSRLSDAGEQITETLFNALIINGLPGKYEHFVVQESFNPASTFTELRTRLQNYEDSRIQRKQPEVDSSVAMHTGSKRDGNTKTPMQSKVCYVCGNSGHFAKQCNKRGTAICSKCNKRGHLAKVCRNSEKVGKSKRNDENAISSYSECFLSPLQERNDNPEVSSHLIVDTGCSDHIVNQKDVFTNLRTVDEKSVRDPKGNFTAVEGIGDVPITVELKDGKTTELILRNVLYVPNYKVNLLSVNKAVNFDHRFIFDDGRARMVLSDGREIHLTKNSGLFFLKVTYLNTVNPSTCNETRQCVKGDIDLWHKRLGHLNKVDVKRTVGCGGDTEDTCKTCAMGKQASQPVPKRVVDKAKKALELVYSDILGPFEVASLNGSKYAVTFIDEYTKYAVVKYMRNKSEVIDKFKEYVAENGTPKTQRSDNGAEYTSRKFKELCRDLKVKQEFTVPETPQQNGVAERFNRTLVEMGRCLLIQAKLPKKYWVRALDTATHIRNFTVSANSNEGKSPFELFTKKTARRNHLIVFGCTAYVKKRNVNLRKLDARSVKAKFVGYDSKSTAYILQDLTTNKLIKARNVLFKEDEIQPLSSKEELHQEDTILKSPNLDLNEDCLNEQTKEKPVGDEVGETENEVPNAPEQLPDEEEDLGEEEPLPRASRNRRPPERYGNPYTFCAIQHEEIATEPKTYEEAVKSNKAKQWKEAMQAEVESLENNDTWTFVDRPKDKNVLPGKWVYRVKYGADGQVDKYKARYVAKGYAQVEGIDFFETYAPTCKPETFRTLLAVAAQKDLHLGQMDVKSAYLHSAIEEEIYLEQPQGFVKRGQNGETLVCKLNKSIYGLKQAAKNWYEALANLLISSGFHRSRNDYCLFVRKDADGIFSYVLVWVDDIIVAGASNEIIDEIKSLLEKNFKMDDRVELHWFLGMRILRSEDGITVDQEKYIANVLKQFNMSDSKPKVTPAEVNLKLVKDDGEHQLVDTKLYRSLVGSLLYIGKQTRPDILNVVNQLSRFFEKPNTTHWQAAKHVLRFLKGTINLRLTLAKNSSMKLVGNADADWSGDLDDRKSITCYYFKFQGNGAAISWEVKKQATVALSSTEAEYQAMAAAVQEAIYLRALMKDFGYPMKEPTYIGEDNQSCIKMCHNPVMHKRSKHIDTKLHFMRESRKRRSRNSLYSNGGHDSGYINQVAASY